MDCFPFFMVRPSAAEAQGMRVLCCDERAENNGTLRLAFEWGEQETDSWISVR